MKIKDLLKVKNCGELRTFAIEWQRWACSQRPSWGELIKWQDAFRTKAEEYSLVEELEENGII